MKGTWMWAVALLAACEGPEGPVGPAGPTGPAGADGENGENGATGPTGADGEDGEDGEDGVDGADGQDGWDAHQGDAPWGIDLEIVSVTGGTGSALRFEHDGPWRRVDGVRIADSIANLSSGRLQAPINQTLDGSYLALNFVWTGANSNGSANLNCDGWTSTANQGVPGLANHSNSSWTFLSEGPCDEFMRLYCLSDSDELFVDGHDAPGLP